MGHRAERHTGEDRQSIIGYVNVKDLISTLRVNPAGASLHSIIRKLPDLQIDQPLLRWVGKLIRAHTHHVALVRDIERRIVGMISLEDIIEELVGEIQDVSQASWPWYRRGRYLSMPMVYAC